ALSPDPAASPKPTAVDAPAADPLTWIPRRSPPAAEPIRWLGAEAAEAEEAAAQTLVVLADRRHRRDRRLQRDRRWGRRSRHRFGGDELSRWPAVGGFGRGRERRGLGRNESWHRRHRGRRRLGDHR